MTKEEILEYMFNNIENFNINEIKNIVNADDTTQWSVSKLCNIRCRDCIFRSQTCKHKIQDAIKYAYKHKLYAWMFI